MPVQALIRNLTRAQVEKAVADSKQSLLIQDYQGTLLLVVDQKGETPNPAACAALQKIADADAAITYELAAKLQAEKG
jgi:trehalose-6-phosphatase